VRDLKKTADLLCVRFISLFPRFEKNVSDSVVPCEVEIVEISLKHPRAESDGFRPDIGQGLIRVFDLLSALHSAFMREYGGQLKLSEEDSIVFHKRSLENRATTDEQLKVLESIMFFRKAFSILFH
jgi:hypothetical protein